MAERKVMPAPRAKGFATCSRCRKDYCCDSYFIKSCFCEENAHIHE